MLDGYELKDALLDLFQPVVILVEDLFCLGHRGDGGTLFSKGEIEDGIKIGAQHRSLGRAVGCLFQLGQLLEELFAHLLGHACLFNTLGVLVDLVILVLRFTKLVLYRLDLLAQEITLLRFVDLAAHALLNIVLAGEKQTLLLQRDEQPLQTRAGSKRLQHALLVAIIDERGGGNEIGKGQRLLDRQRGHLHLLGKGRMHLRQRFDMRAHIHHERLNDGGRRGHALFLAHNGAGTEEAVLKRDLAYLGARDTLKDDGQIVLRVFDHVLDRRYHTHGVEGVDARFLVG